MRRLRHGHGGQYHRPHLNTRRLEAFAFRAYLPPRAPLHRRGKKTDNQDYVYTGHMPQRGMFRHVSRSREHVVEALSRNGTARPKLKSIGVGARLYATADLVRHLEPPRF